MTAAEARHVECAVRPHGLCLTAQRIVAIGSRLPFVPDSMEQRVLMSRLRATIGFP